MPFAELTPEQQAAVNECATQTRAIAGELARCLEHAQAVVSYYVGNVEGMLAGLDGADLIPNASGLSGAQGLTKTELVNLIGYLITASATGDGASGSYNTNYHRALYAKACGPGGILG